MMRDLICLAAAALWGAGLLACSDNSTSDPASGGTSGTGGVSGSAGASVGGAAGTVGSGGAVGSAICEQVATLAESYKTANPGNGGKDWDINAKTPAEIAADPAAQELRSLCGKEERPIIPLLAWEYGGSDHQWIAPEASAPVYCVYIPVNPSSENWQYDPVADHVTADVYVRCPDQNPCKDEQGADQVMACLGDSSNIEILVDTASLDDGNGAGLSLSNASTDLKLILSDTTKVHLYSGL